MTSFPSEHSEAVALKAGEVQGVRFDFIAALIRIQNIGPAPAYFSLRSTAGATTDDHLLAPGGEFVTDVLRTSGLCVTSTGDTVARIGGWVS